MNKTRLFPLSTSAIKYHFLKWIVMDADWQSSSHNGRHGDLSLHALTNLCLATLILFKRLVHPNIFNFPTIWGYDL